MLNAANFPKLDTSFVNVEAMVKHLCRQGFAGALRVEFNGYDARIVIADNGKVHVSARDLASNEITIGESAFSNIVERAKQPGGVVSMEDSRQEPLFQDVADIVDHLWKAGSAPNSSELVGNVGSDDQADAAKTVSNAEHELLVEVTGALLKEVEGAMKRAGIDFSSAFERACREVSGIHPSIAPDKRIFKYSAGLVYVNENANVPALLKGIGDALARLFNRLSKSPELQKTYKFATHRVRVLLQERKDQFDRLFLTSLIERALKA